MLLKYDVFRLAYLSFCLRISLVNIYFNQARISDHLRARATENRNFRVVEVKADAERRDGRRSRICCRWNIIRIDAIRVLLYEQTLLNCISSTLRHAERRMPLAIDANTVMYWNGKNWVITIPMHIAIIRMMYAWLLTKTSRRTTAIVLEIANNDTTSATNIVTKLKCRYFTMRLSKHVRVPRIYI